MQEEYLNCADGETKAHRGERSCPKPRCGGDEGAPPDLAYLKPRVLVIPYLAKELTLRGGREWRSVTGTGT